MSNNQYQIEITASRNQINQNPSNCSDVSTWGILTFTLTKNGSPDTSNWNNLQIEEGDVVVWVWNPGSYQTGFPPNTSLAWLLMSSAELCTPNCNNLPLASLQAFINPENGSNLNQNGDLPSPASACPGYGGNRSYATGPNSDPNTITIEAGAIHAGNSVKLKYTIWFQTNGNYWYYDPEVDVKPAM